MLKYNLTYQKKLENLLRNIRIEKGFTQSQLANKLNKPQSFISKYENGERKLEILEVYEVCECLGISFVKFAELLEENLRGVNETIRKIH